MKTSWPSACWVILHAFLLSADFFSKSILDADQAPAFCWGLIWVQIVCKGYQQTTLATGGAKGLVAVLAHTSSIACWVLKKKSADFFVSSKITSLKFLQ